MGETATRMSQRDRLLAVLAGEQPDRIPFIDRLEVWYTLMATPLPDGGDAHAVAPFHIVRLARSPLAVRFVQAKTRPVY